MQARLLGAAREEGAKQVTWAMTMGEREVNQKWILASVITLVVA